MIIDTTYDDRVIGEVDYLIKVEVGKAPIEFVGADIDAVIVITQTDRFWQIVQFEEFRMQKPEFRMVETDFVGSYFKYLSGKKLGVNVMFFRSV